MAKISCIPSIAARITIELSEEEASALDALVGYGADSFLKTFYENMGRVYLQPYERGLRSLFESVRSGDASVQSFLARAADAREVFRGTKHTVTPQTAPLGDRDPIGPVLASPGNLKK